MSEDVRPRGFDDFVGQKDVIAIIRRAVIAARHHNRPCGHMLFTGFAGTGKTSLSNIIANEMGSKLHVAVAPAIEHKGELTALLTGAGPRDVVFLDEIHGLDKAMQELLYTAAEDGVVDLPAGKRMIRLPLQPFTLVGATTRVHMLTGPLRDRFAYSFTLGHYASDELALIASRAATRLGLSMDDVAATEIGRRARGTPRVANRLVRATRDFMQAAGLRHVDQGVACTTLDALGIDPLGLTADDRAYLALLVERVGCPVGIGTIAAQLGVERGTVEHVVEPHLLEAGLVARTQQGRVATPAAVAHMQVTVAGWVERYDGIPDATADAEEMS